MTKFHIEIPDGHGVPDEVPELAQIILNDAGSTIREKQLAWICIKLSNAVNNLVCQLNGGSATVVVEESATYHKT